MESTKGGQEQKDVDGGIPEFHQAAHETDGTNSDTEAELLRNMASMVIVTTTLCVDICIIRGGDSERNERVGERNLCLVLENELVSLRK